MFHLKLNTYINKLIIPILKIVIHVIYYCILEKKEHDQI